MDGDHPAERGGKRAGLRADEWLGLAWCRRKRRNGSAREKGKKKETEKEKSLGRKRNADRREKSRKSGFLNFRK